MVAVKRGTIKMIYWQSLERSKTIHYISLQEKLQAYYTHQSIIPEELGKAKHCTMNICTGLQKFLHRPPSGSDGSLQ
ncbi:hypothetical protein chiPu_0005685 [Chiloscyllium punctatum]|uniref:Uncharacterized protein n=1 Tax=Chiloscyllium punctatum TaxID=137246 RepID=A0A401SA31_CHIPU|nr:hypothetical protein [Chiloscyllium punctatum]